MAIETGITNIPTSRHTLTTETYDIATIQRQGEMEDWINKALQEVVERGNMTPELVKKIAHSYELLMSRSPMNRAERINEEREENLRIYTEYKKKLYEEYVGRYVVIAKGKIQAVGESFDDVKNVAMDANHRFIFKVESKEKVRGRLRWPMKKI